MCMFLSLSHTLSLFLQKYQSKALRPTYFGNLAVNSSNTTQTLSYMPRRTVLSTHTQLPQQQAARTNTNAHIHTRVSTSSSQKLTQSQQRQRQRQRTLIPKRMQQQTQRTQRGAAQTQTLSQVQHAMRRATRPTPPTVTAAQMRAALAAVPQSLLQAQWRAQAQAARLELPPTSRSQSSAAGGSTSIPSISMPTSPKMQQQLLQLQYNMLRQQREQSPTGNRGRGGTSSASTPPSPYALAIYRQRSS